MPPEPVKRAAKGLTWRPRYESDRPNPYRAEGVGNSSASDRAGGTIRLFKAQKTTVGNTLNGPDQNGRGKTVHTSLHAAGAITKGNSITGCPKAPGEDCSRGVSAKAYTTGIRTELSLTVVTEKKLRPRKP